MDRCTLNCSIILSLGRDAINPCKPVEINESVCEEMVVSLFQLL
jgi:hypothetical protein